MIRTFSFATSFDEDQGKFPIRTPWYVEEISDDQSRKWTKGERPAVLAKFSSSGIFLLAFYPHRYTNTKSK